MFDVLQHAFLRRRRGNRDFFHKRDKSTYTALFLLALLLRVLFESDESSGFRGALCVLDLVDHFRPLELLRTHGAHTLARHAFFGVVAFAVFLANGALACNVQPVAHVNAVVTQYTIYGHLTFVGCLLQRLPMTDNKRKKKYS